MRGTTLVAISILLAVSVGTLIGFLSCYQQMESPTAQPEQPKTSVEAMFRVLIGMVVFTTVGGAVLGNAVCLLLCRPGR